MQAGRGAGLCPVRLLDFLALPRCGGLKKYRRGRFGAGIYHLI
nr:MAG TPA: hypothetical protein [Caudoviricetes sp.]